PKGDYEIIANLENKGTNSKAYCRVNYTLLVFDGNISYTSKEILTKLIQNIQKKELVKKLHDCLKLKFEIEEENTLELLANIIYNVVEKVKNNEQENVPNIILKKLICVQSKKPKEDFYGVSMIINILDMFDFDNKNAEIKAFKEKYFHDVQNHFDN
ncbi:21182_t:CDS:2, partial [Cetraspora pellucida]